MMETFSMSPDDRSGNYKYKIGETVDIRDADFGTITGKIIEQTKHGMNRQLWNYYAVKLENGDERLVDENDIIGAHQMTEQYIPDFEQYAAIMEAQELAQVTTSDDPIDVKETKSNEYLLVENTMELAIKDIPDLVNVLQYMQSPSNPGPKTRGKVRSSRVLDDEKKPTGDTLVVYVTPKGDQYELYMSYDRMGEFVDKLLQYLPEEYRTPAKAKIELRGNAKLAIAPGGDWVLIGSDNREIKCSQAHGFDLIRVLRLSQNGETQIGSSYWTIELDVENRLLNIGYGETASSQSLTITLDDFMKFWRTMLEFFTKKFPDTDPEDMPPAVPEFIKDYVKS